MINDALRSEISRLAEIHEIEPPCLLAVVLVESGGILGTRIDGRMEPLIRFEGHYFYRMLGNAKRNRAVVQGLASQTVGRVKNPVRQSARWKLLSRASKIDRTAAFQSCSWGVEQVMGAHWRWLGYASVDALVAEARKSALGQVQLMMRYIETSGLTAKLNEHDWAGFARAYNGPGYRRNKYDRKLRAAYRRFAGQASQGNNPPSSRNALPLLRLGSFGAGVSGLQAGLKSLGYSIDADRDFGPATERALKCFQAESGLVPDGVYGPKTLEVMSRRLPLLCR